MADGLSTMQGPVKVGRAVDLGRARVVGATALTVLIGIAAVNAAVFAGQYRWWANFVLLPGAALLLLAVSFGARHPVARFVAAWLGSVVLVTGLLLLLRRMGDGWPLLIAVPCVGPAALLTLRPADRSVAAMVRTVGLLGVLGVALGVTFLAIINDVVDTGGARWWITYEFAAGTVAAGNGLYLLLGRRGGYWFSVSVLLLALGGGTVLVAFRELRRWIM